MIGLLAFSLLLVVLIAIPVGIMRRKATERGMLAEGRRIADKLQAEGAYQRAAGVGPEVEAQRLIDSIIAPKFGGTGAQLLRAAPVRQAVFDAVMEGFAPPGTIRATEDWARDPTVPRRGDHSSTVIVARPTHNGLAYDLHSGNEVVYRRDGEAFTWRSEAAFQTWADGGVRQS
jgi:hypothetical protein